MTRLLSFQPRVALISNRPESLIALRSQARSEFPQIKKSYARIAAGRRNPFPMWQPSRSQLSIDTNEQCHCRLSSKTAHVSGRVSGDRSTRRPKGKEISRAQARLLISIRSCSWLRPIRIRRLRRARCCTRPDSNLHGCVLREYEVVTLDSFVLNFSAETEIS